MPGMRYDEAEAVLEPGAQILLYSDGRRRGARRRPRDVRRAAACPTSCGAGSRRGERLIDRCSTSLAEFTGAGRRAGGRHHARRSLQRAARPTDVQLADFSVASEPGNEREAIRLARAGAGPLGLPAARLERLKTAVAEATMNAMEHGNGLRRRAAGRTSASSATAARCACAITDQGGARPMPDAPSPTSTPSSRASRRRAAGGSS